MKTHVQATLRWYGFEEVIQDLPAFAELRLRRSIADLQLAAGYIWGRESGRGKCPSVRPSASTEYSECIFDKPPIINLAKPHRNLFALLHELAHALGTRDKLDHGPAFRKRCIRLYREYGGWSGEVTWDNPKRENLR